MEQIHFEAKHPINQVHGNVFQIGPQIAQEHLRTPLVKSTASKDALHLSPSMNPQSQSEALNRNVIGEMQPSQMSMCSTGSCSSASRRTTIALVSHRVSGLLDPGTLHQLKYMTSNHPHLSKSNSCWTSNASFRIRLLLSTRRQRIKYRSVPRSWRGFLDFAIYWKRRRRTG